MGGHDERRKHEPRDNDRAPGDLTRRSVLESINLAFFWLSQEPCIRILLLLNRGFGTCYPLPHRDSQGRQTAASMRLGGNQKAKPSRGEGRERTGGRAATEPQTRCWRGPKEADHGATEPRLCSPWLGGPHTPSSVKQFKN